MKRIYVDTSAATPLDKRVYKAMRPYLEKSYGNPSSIHDEGQKALAALANARVKVAECLGAHADEIVFTSGGTEANNLAIIGTAQAFYINQPLPRKPGHMLVSAIEHPSVLEACRAWEARGWQVDYIPVSSEGILDVNVLKKSLRPDTTLVSVMYGNNEIGTLQPLAEIKKAIRHYRKGTGSSYPYFHVDACQATRFYDLSVEKLGVDLVTLNGSKMYGPKGSGVLYVRRGVDIAPLLYGGGQENGIRSGTENVAAAVGLAEALIICQAERETETKRLLVLRDYFISRLLELIRDTELNGGQIDRLPHNINIDFMNISAEHLVIELDTRGVACSTGSACSAATKDESYVILALGKDRRRAESSVRFTLGREITKRDLDYILKILPPIVEKLRRVNL